MHTRLVVLALTGLVLTGCGSDPSSSATPTPVTPTVAPTTAEPTSAAPTPGVTLPPSPASSPAPTSADPAVTALAGRSPSLVGSLVKTVLSYDYRHLEPDLTAAEAAATGTFATRLKELHDKVVRPMAVTKMVSTTGAIKAVGVVSATSYVVVLDQTTTAGASPPRTVRSATTVTITPDGKVSSVTPLGTTTVRTSSPLLDEVATQLAPLVGPTPAGVARLRSTSTPAFQSQLDKLSASLGGTATVTGAVVGVGLLSVTPTSDDVLVCLHATSASGGESTQQLRATFVRSGKRLLLDALVAV